MGIIAIALRHMFAAGMTQDAIMQAIEDMENALPEVRPLTPRQARNKRYYERLKASENVLNKTVKTVGSPPSSFSPTPPHITTPSPITPSEAIASVSPKAKKGSRLPSDWHPSESLWQKAKDKLGLTDEFLRFETGAFRDHWHASANANALKLDWDGAWRNWMREAFRRRGNGRGQGPPAKPFYADEICDRIIEEQHERNSKI